MRFDGDLYNKPYTFKYPKAGDKNSVVELWLYDIATGQKTRIDVGAEKDQYVPFIEWTPAGELYFFRINRKQNHFEVVLCRETGEQKVIYD
jgi:dipeptidyl-peptidase-4